MEAFPPAEACYGRVRRRFLAAARARGARLDSLTLPGRGPGGEALAVDIARLGPARAPRLLVHTSGLHGVEGFAGSLVQRRLLEVLPEPPPGIAVVLVHGLNPWGMAWLRRVNEHNVDLNRNFLPRGDDWSGAPPAYALLDPLLNPPSPPRADGFYLRALWLLARHGLRPLAQGVAGGQYDYPRGLFYGGHRPEPSAAAYTHWLESRLPGVERLVTVDVHTGLGRWGRAMALHEHAGGALDAAARARAGLQPGAPAYTARGAMVHMYRRLAGDRPLDVVLQEHGTWPLLRMLHALREENRQYHYDDPQRLDHPARRRLLAAAFPASRRWRRRCVHHGVTLVRHLLEGLAGSES